MMLRAIFMPSAFLAIALIAAGYQCAHLRISNGHNASPHSSPWIVSIQSQQNLHVCAGAIINASWVLTSQHCAASHCPLVVAGLYNLGIDETANAQQRTINFTRVYRPNSEYEDIALIHIDPPFEFNADVQPIALPAAGQQLSGEATLFGWGSTSTDVLPSYPNILQTAKVQLWTYAECLNLLGNFIMPTMVCTDPSSEAISICRGDYGSPLSQDSQLVGIALYSDEPCGMAGESSLFTRTSAFVDWIAQVQRDDK